VILIGIRNRTNAFLSLSLLLCGCECATKAEHQRHRETVFGFWRVLRTSKLESNKMAPECSEHFLVGFPKKIWMRLARCSRKFFRCQVALALLCGLFCPVLMTHETAKTLLQNLACSAWSWGGLRPSNVQEGIVNDQWSVGIMFLTAVSVPRGRRVGLCLAQPAATASWIALVVLGEWGRRKWRHDLQGQFARSLQDLPKFCKFFS